LLPDDLTESLLLDVLDGVRVLYVNGRSREAELLLAQKVKWKCSVWCVLLSSVYVCYSSFSLIYGFYAGT